MQIDAREWLRRFYAGEYVRVFLDGVDVTTTDVIAADDHGITRYVRDADGRLRPDADGDLPTETVSGHVEFVVERVPSQVTH